MKVVLAGWEGAGMGDVVRVLVRVAYDNRPDRWMTSKPNLWVKELPTVHAPSEGDEVVLWSTDDLGDGPVGQVQRRWWDADGTVTVELAALHVDPTAEVVEQVRRLSPAVGVPFRQLWWTVPAGDPEQGLTAGGWQRWA